MQKISENLKNALELSNPKYIKKAFLFPRKKDPGGGFNPVQDISEKIVEISSIKWKLDNEDYAVWNTPNTVITLSNKNNEFREGGSFFEEDSIIHKSKIIIYAGAVCRGGAETVPVFEGYILNSPVYYPEEKTVNFTLSGRLAELQEIDAGEIKLTSLNEEAVILNETSVCTQLTSVSKINEIRRGFCFNDSANLLSPYDYEVSDLNIYKTPAVISLKNPLKENEKIWLSYSHWYEDKEMNWIIKQIADAAMLDKRDIQEVSFGSNVINKFSEGAGLPFKGKYEGTEYNKTSVTLSSEFPFDVDFEWEVMETTSSVSWNLTVNGVMINGSLSDACVSARSRQDKACGTWQFSASPDWDGERCFYHFISDNGLRQSSSGYALSFERRINGFLILRIYRVNNGVLALLGSKEHYYAFRVSDVFIRIVRYEDGSFRIFSRPTKTINVSFWTDHGILCSDNTYKVSNYQIAVFYSQAGGNNISNIKYASFTPDWYCDYSPQGSYTSGEIDLGGNFRSWDKFELSQTVSSGVEAACEIRFKETEHGEWSGWIAISDGEIPSGQARYAQLRWLAKLTVNNASLKPYLHSWSLGWRSSKANIGMVNTSGMSALDVMKELSKLSTFEIGFDRESKFLFRARNEDKNNYIEVTSKDIVRVENINSGVDYVYNVISADFGGYKATASPQTMGEGFPDSIDINGRRELSLASASLLPPDSVDMAATISAIVYDYLSKRKKRAVIIIKFLPQLDLGDILKITYAEPLITNKQDKSLNGVFMRIEGVEFDLENWQMRIDAVEVL
ncbi:hypothetical protein Emin_1077 [Elusimicrobium minutum Pei191]|uniref:Uncharacterized protein n=1 Tax=Elusimicrobium minutum (strain Pei191) TaxID=445932 RepID=B2KDN3_ELUMP|nr:hypothetical protein [Elusimicrobium minutum]ACC98629.1 hypothetical protein Emin_1077 [Elusimicrobium minutum Pei191]